MSVPMDEWALDKIMAQVCPFCGQERTKSGKPMRQVLTHIQAAHGYTGAEIRVMLRLPRSFPLTSDDYHALKVEQGKSLGNLTDSARAESVRVRQAHGTTVTPAGLDSRRASIKRAQAVERSRDALGRYAPVKLRHWICGCGRFGQSHCACLHPEPHVAEEER